VIQGFVEQGKNSGLCFTYKRSPVESQGQEEMHSNLHLKGYYLYFSLC
jgi:hypothetical protein